MWSRWAGLCSWEAQVGCVSSGGGMKKRVALAGATVRGEKHDNVEQVGCAALLESYGTS